MLLQQQWFNLSDAGNDSVASAAEQDDF